MKSYIFITTEGHTYQPGSKSISPDINNLQVIGFASGEDEHTALRNLVNDESWIKATTFNEVKCYELKHNDYEKQVHLLSLKY